jgi:hypothetical protein
LADTNPHPPPDNHENVCRDVSAIFSLPNKKKYRTKPPKMEQDYAEVEKSAHKYFSNIFIFSAAFLRARAFK